MDGRKATKKGADNSTDLTDQLQQEILQLKKDLQTAERLAKQGDVSLLTFLSTFVTISTMCYYCYYYSYCCCYYCYYYHCHCYSCT